MDRSLENWTDDSTGGRVSVRTHSVSLVSSAVDDGERYGRPRKTIYRLHCHSIVGCEESPVTAVTAVTAVAAAGLPAGSFVSVTGSSNFYRLARHRAIPVDVSGTLTLWHFRLDE